MNDSRDFQDADSVRAVSAMRPNIVCKNQNTLPPRLLSQPYHVVEVCRGKEVLKAKVILVSFFNNRVYTNLKVLARDRLVSIGILPKVNTIKTNRDAKRVMSDCSRIIGLPNNQKKSRKRATIPKKEEKATTRMHWLLWELYFRCAVSRKTRSYWILKKANKPGETRWKKSWDQFKGYGFTVSTLRQASIREEKAPSLGKK